MAVLSGDVVAEPGASQAARDPLARLLQIPWGERNRLLMLEENRGFSTADVQEITAALEADSTAPLKAKLLAPPGGIETPDIAALDQELAELQAAFLNSGREAPAPRARAIAPVLVEPSLALDRFISSSRTLFPVLPWRDPVIGTTPVPGLRALVSTSPRSIDVVGNGQLVANLKISRPRLIGGLPTFRDRLTGVKRWMMDAFFGVDRNFDPGALRTIDALHCLTTSAALERLLADGTADVAMIREVGAVVDEAGAACLIREAHPWPNPNPAALMIPYFCVASSSPGRGINLFEQIVSASGRDPVDLALDLGGMYLAAWWQLMSAHRLTFLMPHAQNALFELFPNGRLGRVVVKDMRDMDLWSRYRDRSSRATRLAGAGEAYLRYEMDVHPFYYDNVSLPGRTRQLAANVFNYGFRMLRSYVLRGLELKIATYGAGSVEAVRRGFIDAVLRAADGAAARDTERVPPRGRSGPTMLQAMRLLRARYVAAVAEWA